MISNIPEVIITNEGELSSQVEIADVFLQHCSAIGPKLANKINRGPYSAASYMRNGASHTMFLQPNDQHEIDKVIDLLKSKTSPGIDGISTKLLKTLKQEITKPLINKSLTEGVVIKIK